MTDSVFTTVLPSLRSWRETVLQSLRDPDKRGRGIPLKTELDRAIACLELCQQYHLDPRAKVIAVPLPETKSVSSEYRLIEDNETDDRDHWIEVKVNGEFIRPLPGSLIIENFAR